MSFTKCTATPVKALTILKGSRLILIVPATRDKVETISPSNFKDLKVWERRHLQEWIRTNPGMLLQGDSDSDDAVLIVSMEFDQFSYGDHENIADRLDLLGIDKNGNLVVIEFKRDLKAGYAELQAIRYAAMISSMTIDELVPIYVRYLQRFPPPGEDAITLELARRRIVEFAFGDVSRPKELSKRPRIILCSQDFSPQITTTVLWLQPQVDIRCVKLTPYEVDGKIVIVPNVIIPLPEAKEYQVRIARKEAAQAQAERQSNAGRFDFQRLLRAKLLTPGETLYFGNLPQWATSNSDDAIFKAIVTGEYPEALRWEADGKSYSPSRLASLILTRIHPEQKESTGDPGAKNRWTNKDGQTLAQLELSLEQHASALPQSEF